MVAFPPHQRVILPIAPVAAGLVWVALAGMFAAVSPATLDGWAWASGLPTLLAVARPPLGFTARLLLILLGGGGAALATWLALSFTIGARAVAVRHWWSDLADRAGQWRDDRHAIQPCAPLSASRELGTPFLEVTARAVERPIPRDLDQPLSAFDPVAIPDVPAAPVPALPPLAKLPPLVERPDRIETFELTPMVRPATGYDPAEAAIVAPTTLDTIQGLLDRLERGVARRDDPAKLVSA